MSQLNDPEQHICPNGRPDCSIENWVCGDCFENLFLNQKFLKSACNESKVDVHSLQNFSCDRLDEPVICKNCNKACGSTENCDLCQDFLAKVATGFYDELPMHRPQQTCSFVGGGGAKDVPPITKSLKCSGPPTCQPKLGSLCDYCLKNHFAKLEEEDKRNSPKNPNPPQNVNLDPTGVYGPRSVHDLGACTEVEIEALRIELWALYLLFLQGKYHFEERFPKTKSMHLLQLAKSNVPAGFEGHKNNCFAIMGFFIISLDKQIQDRIDTSKFAGFILRYIANEFHLRLFVNRKLTELFRQEAAKLMNGRDDNDFMSHVSCPNDYLARLETYGILLKGPPVSKNSIAESQVSASFVVNEIFIPSTNPKEDGTRCVSLPEALSLVLREDIQSGSFVCFQFKENICARNGDQTKKTARPSGAGSMRFPDEPFMVNGIYLNLVFFSVIEVSHYREIIFLDGNFFEFNSLSPLNEGHHLPVLTVLSRDEAIELWKKNAHTVVFKCERSNCSSGQWVPPPPPQASSAQVAWVPSPPPQAPCAQVYHALPPPQQAPCIQVAQEQKKPNNITIWFIDEYRIYDPNEKVLRSIPTGRIIDDIRAGTYEVRVKDTHEMVRIELREVKSNYALPPQASSEQVVQALPHPLPPPTSCVQVAHVSQKHTDKLPMIYGKRWFLITKAINGETIAEGEILKTGKTKQYMFGKSVFSSKDDLEIALQAKYGKQLRQNFC